MGLDVISLDVFRPILPLFDQSRSIYTSLLEFYDAFQHTEPTVKDDSHPFGKYWLQHTKQQSNCLFLHFGILGRFQMGNPSPQQVPSARGCQTMSNTLCGTNCQMTTVFVAQTSILGSCTCWSMCSWTRPNS